MALLQKLKSLLGIGGSSPTDQPSRDVSVTVEREREGSEDGHENGDEATVVPGGTVETDENDIEADLEIEEAEEADDADTAEVDDADEESEPEVEAGADLEIEEAEESEDGAEEDEVDVGADADVDDASDVEDADETDALEDASAAETSASASTDSMTDPSTAADEATEPAEAAGPTEDDAAPEAEKAGDAETASGEPVDSIKGIGPAYADRLAAAGVETVSDLAVADADELAEQTDISATRIQGWIDRASVR